MSKEKSGISAFQKYLTVWVILCMVIGVGIGKFLPQIPAFLNRFEYARVSIPMAILIWVMIYLKTLRLHFGHRTDSAVRSNPLDNIVGMLRGHVLSGRHSLYLFSIMERLADPLLAILVFTFLGQDRFLLPYGIWNRRRREVGPAGSFPEGYRL